ncbi:MAG TPA: MoxR family ATPase [Burkholderiales bacterium]|nr:MoxR family ATPase [Burkholderiales bacterium]
MTTSPSARPNLESIEHIEQRIARARASFAELKAEIARVIVGHEALIEQVFIALVCGGHCLIEGVPGLGKTLMVRSLGEILSLSFSRIQFTPDLMPADITGTNLLADDASGHKVFAFQSGPIFANIVLADEINRATPKTQSALLEAMQESSVTVGGKGHRLESPFMVLATQNPLEMEGTYPLPEAQVDRFFFKLLLEYPSREELGRIADLTTAAPPAALSKVLDGAAVLEMREWVRDVPLAETVKDYAVRLVLATHPGHVSDGSGVELARRCVLYGASPRGLQSLILAAKARALLSGRPNVSFEDIRSMIVPALRHRLILNLEADAEGIASEKILAEVVRQVPEVP